MQQACIRGGLTKTPTGEFMLGPNLDLVPKVNAAYERMIVEEPSIKDNMRTAHRNFLRTAIYLLYADGREKQAQYWFDYLKKQYPNAVPPTLDLADFALADITEEATDTDVNKVTVIVEGLLRQSFMRLMNDEDDSAQNLERLAKRLYDRHQVAKAIARNKRPHHATVVREYEETGFGRTAANSPTCSPILRTKLNSSRQHQLRTHPLQVSPVLSSGIPVILARK